MQAKMTQMKSITINIFENALSMAFILASTLGIQEFMQIVVYVKFSMRFQHNCNQYGQIATMWIEGRYAEGV